MKRLRAASARLVVQVATRAVPALCRTFDVELVGLCPKERMGTITLGMGAWPHACWVRQAADLQCRTKVQWNLLDSRHDCVMACDGV